MAGVIEPDYNYETFTRSVVQGFGLFAQITHAGEPAIDFTLQTIDGDMVTLSTLRGKPVVIEFGSLT